MQVQIRKLLVKIWPLLFIFALWFVFSAPFFLKGKIPFPGDYQVTFFSPWSQYSQFAQPVKNNAMPDVIDQLYPWKHLVVADWKDGQVPLWNPYQFAGTPLLANYQSAVFSPMNLLFFIFPFKVGWGLLILLQPLCAGFGMYWFVRKVSVSHIGSLLSAIAFMFCSFLVTWMGYGTLGYAVVALPFVLVGLEGFSRSKKFGYLLLASTSLAFSFLSGHFQMSLYVLLAGFLYVLFQLISFKSKKIFIAGLLALGSGFLIASIQIFPSIAFYGQSLRSTLFQRPEVIPIGYFITLLAPDFLGNPVTRNDWFGHYAEWGSYIGVLPLVFAFYAFSECKKNKYVIFFVFLAVVSFFLATPTFLGSLILTLHIPVLATSAAGRIIVLLSFSLAVLAGFGIDAWIKIEKKFLLSAISFGVLLLGWGIILGKIGLSPEHVIIAKQNFILPSLFLAVALVGSLFVGFVKQKRLLLILSFTFLILSSFDMYRFASKWQSFSPQSLVFPDAGITKFFQTMKDQRSLGNYGGQVSLYYQLPSIEGYDALYPERFGEFASFVADGKMHPAARSVVDFPKNGKYTKEAIDLLGVSYIIHKFSDTNTPWTFPYWQYTSRFSTVYQDSAYIILKNKYAFPRTFIVSDYKVLTGKQEILSTLFSKDFDGRNAVVLEEDPGIVKPPLLTASTTITSYTSDHTAITVQSSAQALLFLSDTYFPGWHAYVDGREVKIFRADYTFRAIVIPSGTHHIVFQYVPASFLYGIWGTICGIVVCAGVYLLQKKRVL